MVESPTPSPEPVAPPRGGPAWRRRVLIGLVLVAGGAVAAFVLLRVRPPPPAPPPERIVPVRARPPSVRDLPIKIASTVEVRPIQEAHIRPVEAKGVIHRITVDKGDRVRRGQLLVVVDCPDFQDRQRQVEADIRRLRASFRNAERIYQRLQPMRAKRYISQLELDNAQAAMETARARVRGGEARLAQAKQRLAYCRMSAPFTGEVVERYQDPGSPVRPGGRPILTLMRIDRVRLWTTLSERDVPYVRLGLAAAVTFPALPGERFTGRVARFVKGLDRRTRTLLMEIELANRGGRIRPGMFGRAEIEVDRRPQAMLVPSSAVLAQECLEGDRQTCTWVYVVREGRAHRVRVRAGYEAEGEVEIKEGLSATELVIYEGRDVVADKIRVRLGK